MNRPYRWTFLAGSGRPKEKKLTGYWFFDIRDGNSRVSPVQVLKMKNPMREHEKG
jgi:hypothetical protein